MRLLSIAEVRANLVPIIDEVIESEEPVIIPRPGGTGVIILPLEEWDLMNAYIAARAEEESARRASLTEAQRLEELRRRLTPQGRVEFDKLATDA